MKFDCTVIPVLFLTSIFSVGSFAQTQTSLLPHQIALIINTDNPDSRAIADYYCLKRHVPNSHIISLPMPDREIIARRVYDEQIAPVLRRRLRQNDLQDKIKCLITVRGVPLRIDDFIPTGPALKRRDLIIQQLDERFGQLKWLTADFNRLAGKAPSQKAPDPSEKKFKLPRDLQARRRQARTLLADAAQAAADAQNVIDALKPDAPDLRQKQQRLRQLISRYDGLRGRFLRLDQKFNSITDPNEKQSIKIQLLELQTTLQSYNNRLQQIDPALANPDTQKQRYQIIYQALGLSGHCQVLLADRITIDDEQSSCAFDSELSLILWPLYPLRDWQGNNLRAWPTDSDELNDLADRMKQQPPVFMVARLDGSSREIALGLIDKALAAEKILLRGTAYFDARGKHEPNPRFGSYEYTDESLRRTAEFLQKNTALKVVLDDQEALFPPGACPDTTLYCGWYSLRNYIDSFEFNPGAVGYHVASFEAETLRPGEPDSNIWCKRMLENGITATLGPVAEPYLLSFPRPDQFFADLVSGRYCLVECYYRTKPFNSWRLTLIGDPLYRPRFAQNLACKSIKR